MNLSTKLNVSFLLLLFLPLSASIFWLSASYSEKLEEEARARLASDRNVAQLLLQQAIAEFRNLAAAEANHQGLALLVEYKLPNKVEQQLAGIRQSDRLDAIKVLSVRDGRQDTFTNAALHGDRAVAGFETIDSELFVTAAAPLRNKHGLLIGVLLIRRMLEHTGLLEEIARKTGAEVWLGDEQKPPADETLPESLALMDIQGAPLAVLELHHISPKYLLTWSAALISMFVLGLSALLLAVGLHQYLLRSIIRPIVSLTHTADAIGNGEYHARVSLAGSAETTRANIFATRYFGKIFSKERAKSPGGFL